MADGSRFSGKCIVVAGAGHGLGFTYAQRLGREGNRGSCDEAWQDVDLARIIIVRIGGEPSASRNISL
jgi:NAD(P)-dependent dehydrogenase (short-subunit alcohol dehydrogenase family)